MSLEIWSKLSRVEPKSVVKYFWVLYEEFGYRPFTAADAEATLKKKGFTVENVYKILSPLEKAGLLRAFTNPQDLRLKFYQIIMRNSEKTKVPTRDELFKLLDNAADLIRTAVDYNVILLLLFYKAVSDKWDSIVAKYLSEGIEKKDAYAIANVELLALYDEASDEVLSWSHVARKPETIAEIDKALLKISRLNPELRELEMLLNRLGLTELSKGDKRSILVRLIDLFNNYDFSGIDYDVLGDAYQWILAKFAPTKAKEGETYTPREVIKLMVRLLDVENGSKVLDPACGSAAMLIEAYNYVRDKLKGEKPMLKLYGQDYNEVMAAISKMNLLLHGITADAKVFVGDSLENPRFIKELGLDSADGGADYVLANPPWNQDGYGENRLNKPELRKIYKYGYPPNNTADWAWIQLMLWASKRKVAIVLDQGALFRGGKEADIRRRIVDEDLVDAIILLPEKLFYNTGAPGIIMVFDKNKPSERRGKVLFINASNEYVKHPEVRRLNMLSEANITKIVEAYRGFKDIPGFARVVTLDEIRKNDYNLNVPLYVTPIQVAEQVNIAREWMELKRLEQEAQEVMAKLDQWINEIVKAMQE